LGSIIIDYKVTIENIPIFTGNGFDFKLD